MHLDFLSFPNTEFVQVVGIFCERNPRVTDGILSQTASYCNFIWC